MSHLLSNLLNLLSFFFIATHSVAAQSNNRDYPLCRSETCGDINIHYPFWKFDDESTTQFCGYEGFGINCSNIDGRSIPQITFGNDSYYVSRINYDYNNITLADYDVSSVAPGPKDCPRVRHNINLGTLPLNFPESMVNLSFNFNCSGFPSIATEIPCLRRDERNAYVNVLNIITEEDWQNYSCAEKVVTTVFDDPFLFSNLKGNLGRLLEAGFELQWGKPDNCSWCEESDGQCGHHITTGFMCFCPGGRTVPNGQCKVYNTDACNRCEESHGWCDFDYTSGFLCVCPGGRTIPNGNCKGGGINWKLKLVIGFGSIGVGSTLLCVIIFIIYCTSKSYSTSCVASLKHKTDDDKNVETFVMQYGALNTKLYKYNDIKKMTNSFKVKVGQGGFGQVFKGKLSDGRLVAVKLLNSSKANGQEFINEVASIGRTSHVNIVTLLGFCFGYKKRALVYEYMPNGSLEKFIHDHVPTKKDNQHIGITKLYEISLGIARGLDYLHRGCNTRILHLDIKPHNILIDEDFCPKIADFGLAKLYSRKESIVSMLEARGTIGYIAPEVYNKNFGGVSHKSDVYSYGMLLLEMVGGRKNIDANVGSGQTSEIYFPDWIYSRLQKDDFLLDGITSIEENDYARKMTIVGLWCIQPAPNQRPSINEVIEMLEGSMEALEVPPKPFFYTPPRSPATTCSTSESMIEIT